MVYAEFLTLNLYTSLFVPALEGVIGGKMRNMGSSFIAFLPNSGEYFKDFPSTIVFFFFPIVLVYTSITADEQILVWLFLYLCVHTQILLFRINIKD